MKFLPTTFSFLSCSQKYEKIESGSKKRHLKTPDDVIKSSEKKSKQNILKEGQCTSVNSLSYYQLFSVRLIVFQKVLDENHAEVGKLRFKKENFPISKVLKFYICK